MDLLGKPRFCSAFLLRRNSFFAYTYSAPPVENGGEVEVAWPHNGDRLFRRNAIKQRLRSSFARQEKKGEGSRAFKIQFSSGRRKGENLGNGSWSDGIGGGEKPITRLKNPYVSQHRDSTFKRESTFSDPDSPNKSLFARLNVSTQILGDKLRRHDITGECLFWTWRPGWLAAAL